MTSKTKKRLFLIDGTSYIYRAFYAVTRLTNAEGLPTNAIYGFVRMLSKVVSEENPDYLAVALDPRGKTFRHDQYSDYKANRPPMPEDLVPQMPYIDKVLRAMKVPALRIDRVEADDIIGTLSKMGEEAGMEVVIVSGDKDMMQLITSHVRMLDTMKEKYFGEKEVFEKFGVEPGRVIEVMGLMGDTSDNIPGIPGVGEKTARTLIDRFGNLEEVLNKASEIKQPALRKKVEENKELARISRTLVTINREIPLDISLEDLKVLPPDDEKLRPLFEGLGFSRLLREWGLSKAEKPEETHLLAKTPEEVDQWLEKVTSPQSLVFHIAREEEDREIIGIALAREERESLYIPLGHRYLGAPESISPAVILQKLAPLLENEKLPKYCHDFKRTLLALLPFSLELQAPLFDTLLAAYVINPALRDYPLRSVAAGYFEYAIAPSKGWEKGKPPLAEVAVEEAAAYYGEEALLLLRVGALMEKKLDDQSLKGLLQDVELPLAPVLATIEERGVKVDASRLSEMSGELERDLEKLEKEIHQMAGENFNINSPKQLGELLFGKLQLKGGKKTKTGYSTDVRVLEKLASHHPLPRKVLDYRQLMKLKSTYIDALPRLIRKETGRIHTSYNQTGTATGRLSSSNPNLQNIPIRTPLGRRIRRSFVAEEGNLLLSADYSQIELRILAHLSGDETLIDSFRKEEDIHERTACEIFEVMAGLVTSDMRRMAKSINFGIIYGMSPFGLSESLKVSRKEAATFIENYFRKYPKVRTFMENTITEGKERGYVSTLLNRRRYLPDLQSPNKQTREFAERMAINTPVQGSAADLIKMAMISIEERLQKENFQARMIMQVHDELVFEYPQEEKERLEPLVKEEMEGVLQLAVPLTVDFHSGPNWDEAH